MSSSDGINNKVSGNTSSCFDGKRKSGKPNNKFEKRKKTLKLRDDI